MFKLINLLTTAQLEIEPREKTFRKKVQKAKAK